MLLFYFLTVIDLLVEFFNVLTSVQFAFSLISAVEIARFLPLFYSKVEFRYISCPTMLLFLTFWFCKVEFF